MWIRPNTPCNFYSSSRETVFYHKVYVYEIRRQGAAMCIKIIGPNCVDKGPKHVIDQQWRIFLKHRYFHITKINKKRETFFFKTKNIPLLQIWCKLIFRLTVNQISFIISVISQYFWQLRPPWKRWEANLPAAPTNTTWPRNLLWWSLPTFSVGYGHGNDMIKTSNCCRCWSH